jgi:predicted amidohydrolase
MSTWRIAAVQTDCKLGAVTENRATVRAKLAEAAAGGAKLVVFPECVLTGYGFASRADTLAAAEPLPGPSTAALAADCARLGVWAVVGTLERDGNKVYNAAALVGPSGFVVGYRKLHLPCLGADRFTDPGDRPFAVHDLGGLVLGMNICFDGSFPESSRVLALLGADVIALPTNWADNAYRMATIVPRCRAFENHVYYVAVNRVGTESGFHYLGHSSICDYRGDHLAYQPDDRETILYADITPAAARQKHVVTCAGEYEIDRVNWRRPEMYGPLTSPTPTPFTGHKNG